MSSLCPVGSLSNKWHCGQHLLPTYQSVLDGVRVLSLALLGVKLQLQSVKLQELVMELPFHRRPLGLGLGQLRAQVYKLSLERREVGGNRVKDVIFLLTGSDLQYIFLVKKSVWGSLNCKEQYNNLYKKH